MTDGMMHERQFVASFIPKAKRERVLMLLSNPKRRIEFTRGLAHFDGFDERYTSPMSAAGVHTAAAALALLQNKGADQVAWVISEDQKMDNRALPLREALEAVWAGSMGTILSCVPGKLALFRSEEMKSERLLHHP
jgi:hypothetical protein